MEKTVKILVIVCIVLVALLSLTIGMLIGNQQNTRLALKTTNNTNLSVNTTNNTTKVNNAAKNTQSKQNNKLLSPSQAMAIANNYESSFGYKAAGLNYIDFVNTHLDDYGNPYYHVDLIPINGSGYDCYVVIDAKTGAVNPPY